MLHFFELMLLYDGCKNLGLFERMLFLNFSKVIYTILYRVLCFTKFNGASLPESKVFRVESSAFAIRTCCLYGNRVHLRVALESQGKPLPKV